MVEERLLQSTLAIVGKQLKIQSSDLRAGHAKMTLGGVWHFETKKKIPKTSTTGKHKSGPGRLLAELRTNST